MSCSPLPEDKLIQSPPLQEFAKYKTCIMRQGPETLVQNGGPFQGLGLGQDLSIQLNDDHHFFCVIQLRSFWCRQSFGQVHVFSCPSVTCFHAGCFDRESPTESLQQRHSHLEACKHLQICADLPAPGLLRRLI